MWIESHQGLARHPKARKAAARLDINMPQMIGHLHLLWWWAMEYAPDGDLTDFDAFDISLGAGWEGDPNEFVTTLVECGPGELSGFVDDDDEGMWLHDWDEYGGKLHKRRAADAARKRAARRERAAAEDNQTPSGGRPVDGGGTSDGAAYVEDKTGQDKTEPTLLTADAVEVEGPTFDEWWKAYRAVCLGRPTGAGTRKPAKRAWDKLEPDERLQALDAVVAYGRLLELEDGDRQKPYPSKHGSTWLNQRTFDDVGQQLEDRRAASSSASSGGGRRPPPVEAIA